MKICKIYDSGQYFFIFNTATYAHDLKMLPILIVDQCVYAHKFKIQLGEPVPLDFIDYILFCDIQQNKETK